MKCQIPEISWHNRDPVLSVDFQPKGEGSDDDIIRIASGGSDSHVLIWYLFYDEGAVRLDLAADLTRHQRAVNCVRWSPNGKFLASCDDESVICIWRQKPETETANIFDDHSDADKEIWLSYKTLRGHMEDVYDLSFSPDGNFLISGSVDNTAMIWDVEKQKSVAILRDHKGFVQGVSWDPLNKYLATLSTDRFFRIFDVKTKKIVQRNNKSELPVATTSTFYKKSIRLFHDDTLQTFFRRLCFSPDGSLIVTPSGCAEVENDSNRKPLNTTYVYTRFSLNEPALVLPSPDQFTVAVRFCPLLFELRESKAKPTIPLPYRMIFAVATKCSVYLYDTQQKIPFGLISNIHYTRLTDLTWSNDGKILLVSSTDGYCTIVQFADGELGKIYKEQNLQDILNAKMEKDMEPKKKKKVKKAKSSAVTTSLNESIVGDEKMEVDDEEAPIADISLNNLPDAIKDTIPVDKIIKSNDMFSPEKQINSPATPIQVRKCPRIRDELKDLNEDEKKNMSAKDEAETSKMNTTTPKASTSSFLSKTPNRIEVRRYPRLTLTTTATTSTTTTIVAATNAKDDDENWPQPIISDDSPMQNKTQQSTDKLANEKTPKTPRRVEFQTITTPKSKKKLL